MILVIAEQQQGKLNRASWEAIAAAQQLAAGAMPITVAVAGGSNLAGVAGELAQAAVAEVLTIEHAALATYTPDGFVQALQQVIAQVAPTYVFFSHTYQTRDFSPTLATRSPTWSPSGRSAARLRSRGRCSRASSWPTWSRKARVRS